MSNTVRKTVLVSQASSPARSRGRLGAARLHRAQVGEPDDASKLVDACIARAMRSSRPWGAVVDIAGVLVDFHAMGGQATFAKPDSESQDAAIGSAQPPRSKPMSTRSATAHPSGSVTSRRCGVPIMMDGQVTGALGVAAVELRRDRQGGD